MIMPFFCSGQSRDCLYYIKMKNHKHLLKIVECREVNFMNINLTSENIFTKINIDESKGGAL